MEEREWNGKDEMRWNEKRIEREDRPLNTSDGREVRESEPRLMEEGGNEGRKGNEKDNGGF